MRPMAVKVGVGNVRPRHMRVEVDANGAARRPAGALGILVLTILVCGALIAAVVWR